MGAATQSKNTLKFDVEIVKGPHMGLKMSFTKEVVSIGRGPENDIVLANDPRVSRQHAEIRLRGTTEHVIVNLSQKNFIMVNNHMVESEVLGNHTVILIGDTEIIFSVEGPSLTPAASRPAQATAQIPVQTPVVAPAAAVSYPTTGYGGYQPQPQQHQQPHSGSSTFKQADSGLLENPKVRFYGIIGILVLIGFFLFSPSKKGKQKDPNEIRTTSISMQDAAQAEKRSQELLTVKKEKYDSIQYRRAQENFVKGFRDFQQGQYARAREAFQVVLNLDPDNELAQRYFHLSKIKFDEIVKFNMIQGNRYREKKNWRMCQSNYSNVMTMLLNRKDDPSFKEAKQYYEECTLNLEGRF